MAVMLLAVERPGCFLVCFCVFSPFLHFLSQPAALWMISVCVGGVCAPRGWLHSAFSQPHAKEVLSPPSQAVPTGLTHSLPLSSPRRHEEILLNGGRSRGIWTRPGSVLFHRQCSGEMSGLQLTKESSPRCLRAPAVGRSLCTPQGTGSWACPARFCFP